MTATATSAPRTACPSCASTAIARWQRRADDREVWECAGCGLRFLREPIDDIAALYGADYFDKSESDIPAFGYSAYRDILPIDFRWQLALLRLFSAEQGTLLDVGCATGRFLTVAREEGHRATGVELSTDAAARARALGFAVAPSVSEVAGPFDTIAMWEVIEHLPDLRGPLTELAGRLADGGLFMLSTPDTDAPAVLARGEAWIGLRSSLEHLYYLNKRFLGPLLAEIFGCEPLFLSAGAGEYWTLVAVLRKGGLRPSDSAAYQRLIARESSPEVGWFWFSLEDHIAAARTVDGLRAAGQDVSLFEAILAVRRADDGAPARLAALAEQQGWSSESMQWLVRALQNRQRLVEQQLALSYQRVEGIAESRAAAMEEIKLIQSSAGYRLARAVTSVAGKLPGAPAVWSRIDALSRIGIRAALGPRVTKLKAYAARRLNALPMPRNRAREATPATRLQTAKQYVAVQAGLTPDLVSVVLPLYNQAGHLRAAIDGVLAQTYPRVELIVVDDGSTDGTAALLAAYERHERVRIVRQPHQGLPKALSNGFALARGELWTWITTDNIPEPVMLERMIAFMRSRADVDMTYADYLAVDERGQPLRDPRYRPHNRRTPSDPEIHLPRDPSGLNSSKDNFIGPCFLYRGHVGLAIGDYDPAVGGGVEELDYWMRINSLFRIAHFGTDEVLSQYRVHENALAARGAEYKIFDRVAGLIRHDERSRSYRAPWLLEPDELSFTLAARLAVSPRVELARADGGGAAKRVALLAGDRLPATELASELADGRPAVVWFSRHSAAPYHWASLFEHPLVVAIAEDEVTLERIAAAGGRGFGHDDLHRALEAALACIDSTSLFHRTKTARERARVVPEPFRGAHPAPTIALEVQSFDKGGLEQVVIDLAMVLRAGGATPIIVVLGAAGTAARRAERAGIRVVELPAEDRDGAYADLLRREQVALINAHYSLTGARIAARAKIPFVQTIHNSYIWLTDEERRTWADADEFTSAYLCVSNSAAQFSDARLGLPSDKLVVLPNGINTATFAPVAAAERERLRQKHKIPLDTYVYLNVAGLHNWKGQRQLIAAFAEVHRRDPRTLLLIAGGGADAPYRRALDAAIERGDVADAVILTGHTHTVEELYALADAFVLPSFFEGYSLALLEAVCSGLPCIATDCGAAREVLARASGQLVPLPFDSLIDVSFPSLQALVGDEEPLRTRLRDALVAVREAPRPAALADETRRLYDRTQTFARHRDLFDWLIAGGAPQSARRWLRARSEEAITTQAATATVPEARAAAAARG